ADEMVGALERFSRFDLPKNVVRDVRDLHGGFGRLKMARDEGGVDLVVFADDPLLVEEVASHPIARGLFSRRDDGRLLVRAEHRGEAKQALVKMGWPVEDSA